MEMEGFLTRVSGEQQEWVYKKLIESEMDKEKQIGEDNYIENIAQQPIGQNNDVFQGHLFMEGEEILKNWDPCLNYIFMSREEDRISREADRIIKYSELNSQQSFQQNRKIVQSDEIEDSNNDYSIFKDPLLVQSQIIGKKDNMLDLGFSTDVNNSNLQNLNQPQNIPDNNIKQNLYSNQFKRIKKERLLRQSARFAVGIFTITEEAIKNIIDTMPHIINNDHFLNIFDLICEQTIYDDKKKGLLKDYIQNPIDQMFKYLSSFIKDIINDAKTLIEPPLFHLSSQRYLKLLINKMQQYEILILSHQRFQSGIRFLSFFCSEDQGSQSLLSYLLMNILKKKKNLNEIEEEIYNLSLKKLTFDEVKQIYQGQKLPLIIKQEFEGRIEKLTQIEQKYGEKSQNNFLKGNLEFLNTVQNIDVILQRTKNKYKIAETITKQSSKQQILFQVSEKLPENYNKHCIQQNNNNRGIVDQTQSTTISQKLKIYFNKCLLNEHKYQFNHSIEQFFADNQHLRANHHIWMTKIIFIKIYEILENLNLDEEIITEIDTFYLQLNDDIQSILEQNYSKPHEWVYNEQHFREEEEINSEQKQTSKYYQPNPFRHLFNPVRNIAFNPFSHIALNSLDNVFEIAIFENELSCQQKINVQWETILNKIKMKSDNNQNDRKNRENLRINNRQYNQQQFQFLIKGPHQTEQNEILIQYGL